MADIDFLCPHCKQQIIADEAWCGQQIQCPACQANINVPARKPAATARATHTLAPEVPKETKLSFVNQAQKPATENRNIPIRNLAPPPAKKKSPLIPIAQVAGILLILGAAVYFGWPYVQKWQDKANASRRDAEKNADGGQVGHIAELNSVLDKTEPGRPLGGDAPRSSGPKRRPGAAEIALPGDPTAGATPPAATATEATLPLIPAVWTLEVGTAKIPEGKVNGSISGASFAPASIRLDPVPTAQVLRFTEGATLSPDREILLYLHFKAGEKIGGQKLTVSKETRGGGIPSVVKRWKTNPKYAPTMKTYASGYALKLEFGQPTNGIVPGKLFLALPDNEQSVVAGVFNATSSIPEAASDAAAAAAGQPMITPAAPGLSPADRAAFEKRYGIRR
jgi:hypothetical protein